MMTLTVPQLVAFILIVLFSMIINGLIGFAANAIALPLLSIFLDMSTAVAVLALVSTCQCVVQAYQNRRYIDKSVFTRWMTLNILGFVIGLQAVDYLPEKTIKLILAVFIIYIGLQKLSGMIMKNNLLKDLPEPWDRLYLLLGGIFNAAFASGGPLAVIYLSKHIPNKDNFRGTNFVGGVIAMGMAAGSHALQGHYTPEVLCLVAIDLVIMLVAVRISNILIRRINTRLFMLMISVALLLLGCLMLVQNLI